MMLIPCPHCGPRDETEFSYGGEAQVAYPEDPHAVDDAAWARYLFYRRNPKGLFTERWVHSLGCRKWFDAVRNTVTYEFLETRASGRTAAAGTAPSLSAEQEGAGR